MAKQRLILTIIYMLQLNAIVNGQQITSCYVGNTYKGDIGITLTEKCSLWGSPPYRGCKIKNNTEDLEYSCLRLSEYDLTRECQDDPDTKCCYTNNCNRPPVENIPSTSLDSCFVGQTRDGIGALLQKKSTYYNSIQLGQFKACSVKSYRDLHGTLLENYEMASSCKAGTAAYLFYQMKVTCCTTSGCNRLTSAPTLPTNNVTRCLSGVNETPISKDCASQDSVSFSYCATLSLGDRNGIITSYGCASMCKPGYVKKRDGLIYYVSCCTSDNCNTKLTESEIQDIIDGNVSINGSSGQGGYGLAKISSLVALFTLILSSYIILL